MKKRPLLLSIGAIAISLFLIAFVVTNILKKDDSNIISTSVTEDLNVTINATNIVTDENGLVNVTYIITISNPLQTNVENIVATNNIAQNLSPYPFTVVSLNSSNFTTSPNFDGQSNTNLLSEGNTLAAGSSGVITLNISFNPGGNTGPFNNNVHVTGTIAGTPNNNQNNNSNNNQEHNNEQEENDDDAIPNENENENEQNEEDNEEIIGEDNSEEENPDPLPVDEVPSTTGGQGTGGNQNSGGNNNSNQNEDISDSLTQGSASISFMLQPTSSGDEETADISSNPVIVSQSGSGRLPNTGFNFVNSSAIGLIIALSVILLNIKFKSND